MTTNSFVRFFLALRLYGTKYLDSYRMDMAYYNNTFHIFYACILIKHYQNTTRYKGFYIGLDHEGNGLC